MFKRLFLTFLAAVTLALSPATSRAQGFISLDDIAQVTLLPGWRTADGTHMAAIRITLAEGWKTYWRSPGEAGIPPRFDWGGSTNLKAVKFYWPTPSLFLTYGLRSIGYSGETIIPIELTPASAGPVTISLRGQMELGVCSDICIPMTTSFEAELPDSGAPDPVINASLADRPVSATQAGVGAVTCQVEPISDGLRLSARIDMPTPPGGEMMVIELPDSSIWISQVALERKGRSLSAVAEMVPANGAPFLLNRSDVRFTIVNDAGAVEILGCSAG